MSAKSITIGVAAGVAAGVIVGLLTAPQSGSETRQKIADAADTLKKRFRRVTGKASSELDELQSILENEADGLKDDVKERIMKLLAATKESYGEVKAEVMG